ncbi:hypothetical protein K431DRAFT_45285 [Polychaeton citri CBS 116435]|uniref:PLC-like phosphodiesterase n=1 Tax=Polychaeton citri CBS 116435 TaxID=1314669 RepID=A0A9P4QCY6_9PEZI|nr:hypothetical protein K431DRAFT_45285 [Polychaeton citri CBS 116435]
MVVLNVSRPWWAVSATLMLFVLLVLLNWREMHTVLELRHGSHDPHTGPSPTHMAHSHDLRLNEIQVIGTHNSYHREISLAERYTFEELVEQPEDYYYSHATWSNQLSYQGVRSIEIDIHSDEKGGLYLSPLIWRLANLSNETIPWQDEAFSKPGLKVFHVTDADTNSICHTFIECLTQLKDWSVANPGHLPITIDLELKADANYCGRGGLCEVERWTLPRLLGIEREIHSILPPDKLLTPDDVRRPGLTLQDTVLQFGWPTLESALSRFVFYFDNDPDNSDPQNYRNLYRADGHDSLEGRTIFTNAVEGDADAAFIKHNKPDVEEIGRLVKKGYFVRARADVPISTILAHNTTMREQALQSGAHIVSTDFPAIGMSSRWGWDYAVHFEDGLVARCNPVTAPRRCSDKLFKES